MVLDDFKFFCSVRSFFGLMHNATKRTEAVANMSLRGTKQPTKGSSLIHLKTIKTMEKGSTTGV